MLRGETKIGKIADAPRSTVDMGENRAAASQPDQLAVCAVGAFYDLRRVSLHAAARKKVGLATKAYGDIAFHALGRHAGTQARVVLWAGEFDTEAARAHISANRAVQPESPERTGGLMSPSRWHARRARVQVSSGRTQRKGVSAASCPSRRA